MTRLRGNSRTRRGLGVVAVVFYIDSTLSLPQSLAVCYYFIFLFIYLLVYYSILLYSSLLFSIPSWVFVGLHTKNHNNSKSFFSPLLAPFLFL